MDKKLKVAVAGLKTGSSHVRDYLTNGAVGEVVICDTNIERLNEAGDRFGIAKRYADYRMMLSEEKPDAVSVAVPNFLHMPFSVNAMEAGAHVLCEKPMARNADEARVMLECSGKTGKKLMIHFNQRFQREVRVLKSAIDRGDLGEIYFARTMWHRRRGVPWWYPLDNGLNNCGGGALIDIGVHVLDRTMWLCGFPEPEWVLGNTYSKLSHSEASLRGIDNFNVEDMAAAMIKMKNGMMLELEASWASNREDEILMTRLLGTRGGAVLRNVVQPNSQGYNRLFLEKDGELADFDIDGDYADITAGNVRHAFIDAIINNTEVPCTPQQGLLINEVIDAVYNSAASGAPVSLRG
jgi:predicted dehydrogenase